MKKVLNLINLSDNCLEEFSRGYEKFGFNLDSEGIIYREWAPGAIEAYLIGDFSKKIFL